jgi:hypothetical protein
MKKAAGNGVYYIDDYFLDIMDRLCIKKKRRSGGFAHMALLACLLCSNYGTACQPSLHIPWKFCSNRCRISNKQNVIAIDLFIIIVFFFLLFKILEATIV